MNCRFHDENVHHECTEPQAEWVRDKDKPNFCGYFDPSEESKVKSEDKRVIVKGLANLFGDKDMAESMDEEVSTKQKLEELFKK